MKHYAFAEEHISGKGRILEDMTARVKCPKLAQRGQVYISLTVQTNPKHLRKQPEPTSTRHIKWMGWWTLHRTRSWKLQESFRTSDAAKQC